MNNQSLIERFETFLNRLENSLVVDPQKKREIIDEIRSDLRAQVKGLQEEGKSESEAVDLALEEMGDPETLGRSLSEVVPPLSTGPVSGVRYLAAAGLMVWAGMLLWNFRAWTYGFSPGVTAGLIAFHLSLVLMIWPGIIWRWNWLFGLLPAGLCLGVALAIQLAGASGSSSSFTYDLTEMETPAPTPRLSPLVGYSALAGLIGINLLLFYLMQRPQQRRITIAAACLVFLVVEGYFFIDEFRFRRERDRLLALVKDGSPLDDADLGKRHGVRVNLYPNRDGFSLSWVRPLASGYSIHYSSSDGNTYVND